MNYGWDLLAEGNKSTVISEVNAGGTGNPTITTTTHRTGTGPRVGLNFQFHERLIVGTEASYYFKWSEQKTKVTNSVQVPALLMAMIRNCNSFSSHCLQFFS
ncbi:MAG: hypothetical protein WDO15_14265 [Bacteroidota bacterium]